MSKSLQTKGSNRLLYKLELIHNVGNYPRRGSLHYRKRNPLPNWVRKPNWEGTINDFSREINIGAIIVFRRYSQNNNQDSLIGKTTKRKGREEDNPQRSGEHASGIQERGVKHYVQLGSWVSFKVGLFVGSNFVESLKRNLLHKFCYSQFYGYPIIYMDHVFFNSNLDGTMCFTNVSLSTCTWDSIDAFP